MIFTQSTTSTFTGMLIILCAAFYMPILIFDLHFALTPFLILFGVSLMIYGINHVSFRSGRTFLSHLVGMFMAGGFAVFVFVFASTFIGMYGSYQHEVDSYNWGFLLESFLRSFYVLATLYFILFILICVVSVFSQVILGTYGREQNGY